MAYSRNRPQIMIEGPFSRLDGNMESIDSEIRDLCKLLTDIVKKVLYRQEYRRRNTRDFRGTIAFEITNSDGEDDSFFFLARQDDSNFSLSDQTRTFIFPLDLYRSVTIQMSLKVRDRNSLYKADAFADELADDILKMVAKHLSEKGYEFVLCEAENEA